MRRLLSVGGKPAFYPQLNFNGETATNRPKDMFLVFNTRPLDSWAVFAHGAPQPVAVVGWSGLPMRAHQRRRRTRRETRGLRIGPPALVPSPLSVVGGPRALPRPGGRPRGRVGTVGLSRRGAEICPQVPSLVREDPYTAAKGDKPRPERSAGVVPLPPLQRERMQVSVFRRTTRRLNSVEVRPSLFSSRSHRCSRLNGARSLLRLLWTEVPKASIEDSPSGLKCWPP